MKDVMILKDYGQHVYGINAKQEFGNEVSVTNLINNGRMKAQLQ